jgi:histidinol dehydrogenase
MMRIVHAAEFDVLSYLRRRGARIDMEVQETVAAIIADVRNRGDAAVLESARRFDCPTLTDLLVTEHEIQEAVVSQPHASAIRIAHRRIWDFHARQLESLVGTFADGIGDGWRMKATQNEGAGQIGQRFSAVSAAGVYVPGGLAAYPSSVLMNAVPAALLGISPIVVTTPASSDGTLPAPVLTALRELPGVHAVKAGGAAAIAAMAIGTETVPQVDQIVGPGNRYVNEAKRQLWGQVGLDGYAGPSEVCVAIDASTNAAFAAADLLTQVEHASDNTGFVVSTSESKLHEVLQEADKQLTGAPREAIMRSAFGGDSLAIVVRDRAEASAVVNMIAPEHLSITVSDPYAFASTVRNAGCILIGEWSAESAGDYVVGPSHTLPTARAARWQSPVSVLSFLKLQSVIQLSQEDLVALTPVIQAFGEMEGLPAHGFGASIRKQIKGLP